MSEEKIQELMDYNLEYLEAQQSEEIFGGDYTSSVDLKYANKKLEEKDKQIRKYKEVLDKIKEYAKTHSLDDDELDKLLEEIE